MTQQKQIYKCNICGNIIEVLHSGAGTLICCGQPMELLKEKTKDIGLEKHLPVIEKTARGVVIKVGSLPHPMEEKHYIEWIEVFVGGKSYRQFLKPGELPRSEFEVGAEDVKAREYCNVHGLWATRN